MPNDGSSGLIQKLIICLIAAASATVVITIYHCITARYMGWRSRQSLPPAEIQLENSVAELLPAHKYEKGVGVEEGSCAICLSEFEDGEQLRTLPECVHSFHVVCIDMWLYSHANCPMCRTFVAPPTLMHLLHPNHYNTNPLPTY